CAFVADNFEVIGFAPDDGAQRNKSVKLERFSHLRQGYPHFQRTRHRNHHDVTLVDPELAQFVQAGPELSRADLLVESRTHNTDVQTFAAKIGFQSKWIHSQKFLSGIGLRTCIVTRYSQGETGHTWHFTGTRQQACFADVEIAHYLCADAVGAEIV